MTALALSGRADGWISFSGMRDCFSDVGMGGKPEEEGERFFRFIKRPTKRARRPMRI